MFHSFSKNCCFLFGLFVLTQPMMAGQGRFVGEQELATLMRNAQFPEDLISTMTCVVKHESGSFTETQGFKNSNGTLDYGLFQINSGIWFQNCAGTADWEGAKAVLKDPTANARCGFKGYRVGGLGNWSAFADNRNECDHAVSAAAFPSSWDLNGDKYPDLLFRNKSTSETYLWNMNQNSLVTKQEIVFNNLKRQGVLDFNNADTNWQMIGMADFDQDHHNDILLMNPVSCQKAVWYMNGTAMLSYEVVQTSGCDQWKLAGASDFNGDNVPELFWVNTVTGDTGLWDLYGNQAIPAATFKKSPGAGWTVAAVGYLNRDRTADVMWRKHSTGEIKAWYFNGKTFYAEETFTPSGAADTSWDIRAMADYDRDGDFDMLWYDRSTGATGFRPVVTKGSKTFSLDFRANDTNESDLGFDLAGPQR